jgi:hypothetical protein
LDIDVCVGAKEKLRARLVAIPLPEEVAAERRRKAKANRDRRLKPSQERLAVIRLGDFYHQCGPGCFYNGTNR